MKKRYWGLLLLVATVAGAYSTTTAPFVQIADSLGRPFTAANPFPVTAVVAVLPPGAATEATLAGFKTQNNTNLLNLLTEISNFHADNTSQNATLAGSLSNIDTDTSTIIANQTNGTQKVQSNITQILSAAPSATNYLPNRLTDGTSYYDARVIRALTFAGDKVDASGSSVSVTNLPAIQPVSQSGTWTVQQGTPPWSVSQSGTWTTGRTWDLSFAADQVDATGSAVSITNFPATVAVTQSTSPWVVSGTVTVGSSALPTGAATEATQLNVLTQVTAINANTDTVETLIASTNTKLDTVNSNLVTVQGKQDTGNTSLNNIDVDTSTIIANQTNGTQKAQRVDASGNVAPAGDTVGRSAFMRITDGTNTAAVKAASTAAVATDPALVVTVSPNNTVTVQGSSGAAGTPTGGILTVQGIASMTPFRTVSFLNAAGLEGALTVSTSAVEVKVGGSALTNRRQVTLYNNALVKIYWGRTSGVTTTTGTPINAGDYMEWDYGPSAPVYVIAASGSNNTRVTESAE